MSGVLRKAAGAAAGVFVVTWILRALHADSTEAVLAYLPMMVVIAATCNLAIAATAALVAAALMDYYFLPPYGVFSIATVDDWVTLIGFVLAALGGSKFAASRVEQARQRETFIAGLRESEATLERRVRERTEALSMAEERLRLAARATNDALWDWEIGTGTVWWNEAFGSLFGHEMRAPGFETWLSLIHPDDVARVSSGLGQFLDGQDEIWRSEYRLRRGNGSYAWVLDRGFLVRGAGGKARRMIGAMMDITERKEAERMKSDFVSFVSHQLRTPLAGMNWMLELAADSEGLPETPREYIAEARESAARLVSLVNDLLDIARLESGRAVALPGALDMNELTGSVVRELQPLIDDRRHDVSIEAVSPAIARADPQMVRQVVVNLVSNAVKYTPAGGRIAISLKRRNGVVEWAVADSGVGIPRAAQTRLFERFFRADNAVALEVEGTGLGLHLVRLIVEQAGGRVWCDSEEGRGSVFSFTLPAEQEGVPAS